MIKSRFIRIVGVAFLSLTMFSCDNDLHMVFPDGPKGDDGLSAYEVWVKEVNNGTIVWDKNQVDVTNFFLYLKGADGKDGQNGTEGKSAYEIWVEEVAKGIKDPHNPSQEWSKDRTKLEDFWCYLTGAKGQDGSTPTIGDNDNWYINGNDTGIPARGKDGTSGTGSIVTIGDNGNWFIDGVDTGVPARGEDGTSTIVKIGDNGNWFINGVDTGVPARGQNGTSSVVTIGDNGNWFIDGVDTQVPAFGKDGTSGSNGQTAYDLWVAEVKKGLKNPHDPNSNWPEDKITTQDFWDYLKGADGKDGKCDCGTPFVLN